MYLQRDDHDEEDGGQAENDDGHRDQVAEHVTLPGWMVGLQTSGHGAGVQRPLRTYHNMSRYLTRRHVKAM